MSQSRAFDFTVADQECWAQGHPSATHPAVTLMLQPLGVTCISMRLTPGEARAMAVALEAAATYAENTLASGLGESTAEAA